MNQQKLPAMDFATNQKSLPGSFCKVLRLSYSYKGFDVLKSVHTFKYTLPFQFMESSLRPPLFEPRLWSQTYATGFVAFFKNLNFINTQQLRKFLACYKIKLHL
jgi:hypothetical protein